MGRTCCGKGGSWQGNCGSPGDAKFAHTWGDGFEACAAVSPPTTPDIVTKPKCPKCGLSKAGKPTCCSKGGSWQGNCGSPGDAKFEHTWGEGIEVCARRAVGVNEKIGMEMHTGSETKNPLNYT